MVEGGTREVSETDLIAALEFGQVAIREICSAIDELRKRAGKPKLVVTPPVVNQLLSDRVSALAKDRIVKADRITDKQARATAVREIKDEVTTALAEEFPDAQKAIGTFIHDLQAEDVRHMILNEGRRLDGRGYDDIREITCEVGFIPRAHGSAIFTRGQTQALAAVTLGTKMDEQKIDDLEGESWKSYMLHYNFPPYSVGEVRPMRGPAAKSATELSRSAPFSR
jgi:polyribonucleotide nucleotidyltransferase